MPDAGQQITISAREREFLAAKLAGYDGPTTAAIFDVSESTVKNTWTNAAGKLGTKGLGTDVTASTAKDLGLVTDADIAAVREKAGPPAVPPATAGAEGAGTAAAS